MLRNLKFNSFTSTTNSTTHSAVAYVYSFNEHRLFHETSNITHLKTIRVLNVFFWYRKTEQKKSFIEFVYKRKGFVFSVKSFWIFRKSFYSNLDQCKRRTPHLQELLQENCLIHASVPLLNFIGLNPTVQN